MLSTPLASRIHRLTTIANLKLHAKCAPQDRWLASRDLACDHDQHARFTVFLRPHAERLVDRYRGRGNLTNGSRYLRSKPGFYQNNVFGRGILHGTRGFTQLKRARLQPRGRLKRQIGFLPCCYRKLKFPARLS